MNSGYIKEIRKRILSAKEGAVFVTSDFANVADAATIRQIMKRLTQEGLIIRIIKGVYEKPKYSHLLHEYLSVNPEEVANAIARNYHWTIAPCGNTALNLLGLSTQVPIVWSFISDGPYKIYQWGATKIEFKHRTNREITGLSYITCLVIQALKTLGKENVTQEIIQMLAHRLTAREKMLLQKEALKSTDWVYDTIRKIIGGKNK